MTNIIFDQPFQILLDMARDKKIDPWDVDIGKLTGVYANRLREKNDNDLRVSGRALYSASVLLRMKANHPPHNGHSEENGEDLPEELTLGLPELGPLTVIKRSPRKITVSDLVSSLEETMKEPQKTKKKKEEEVEKIKRNLKDYHVNIEKHIKEFHEKIAALAPNGELIPLSKLYSGESKLEMVRSLLLALFLCNDGKVSLHQEESFGEIHIKLEEKPGA
ncbi:MAG: segregation/condensation protein A [Hadesarchaea archaeon]|nr:segregation/condensation protein A [Hadesarchaea archaeon]